MATATAGSTEWACTPGVHSSSITPTRKADSQPEAASASRAEGTERADDTPPP
ncbi:hypothetical protein [Streptomyces viridochromogenes]|uniref:hypothetical protein n=1 Tax=Streptomyces viridochromogenes TaxID=1938 RepID=UPI00131A292F|nr:hypothetical protein [Streptomyces viridochromogenes]